MNSINKYIIALGIAATAGMSACTGDLNVEPKDPNVTTPEKFAEDPKGYMDRVLAECYQGLATSSNRGAGEKIIGQGDAGATSFTRVIFVCNELTTDEFAWIQFNDAGHYELATMQFGADNGVMYTTYSRIYTEIAICNEFLRTVEQGKFYLTPDLESLAAEYCRQVKVIRGLCYFYAIDMFGNGGYSDETMAAGTAPEQMNRADLYAKVVADLEAVSAEWGDTYKEPSYGYVGKEACDALLAKFYLNAKVFTGTPAYEKCWAICQKIIAHHTGEGHNGTGLADSYIALFGANNDEYMAQGSRPNEIIFGIPQQSGSLENYGGSTFYMAASSNNSGDGDVWKMNAATHLNFGAVWNCMQSRQQLAERFGFDANGNTTDTRASLWLTSKDGFAIDNKSLTEFGMGYAPCKFSNFAYTADGTPDLSISPSNTNSFADADWPVIRLAEIYLSAAESNVAGGAGDASTALSYANAVRSRAGVRAWNASELTLDNLLDERSRELYGENGRRTDLVRHNKYAGGAYNWNWKGNVQNGGASTPEYMNLFPIPTTVISFQGYTQNPGY